MKKLLIIAALAMCCCKQQTSECPYTFMGIPLDVTTEEFNQKLKERGFTENEDGTFTGFFFGYFCTVAGTSDLFDTRPELVRMASVVIQDDVFDDIKKALMEKYSDTAKWRIDDEGSDFNNIWTTRSFKIFSVYNDTQSYIDMAWMSSAFTFTQYDRTIIHYYNVDYYTDPDNIQDHMQDL